MAEGGEPVGLLTYALRDGDFEVVTFQTERQGIGAGRALMDAARRRAIDLGARRTWLTISNNYVRAFRFYQRWGMGLAAWRRPPSTRGPAYGRPDGPRLPAL